MDYMLARLILPLWTVLSISAQTQQPPPQDSSPNSDQCDQVLPRCTVRMPCGMALHSYRISCRPELHGSTNTCSEICQQATISLASTSEGYDYIHCDCGRNLYCHTLRNRTASCWPNGADDDVTSNSTSSVDNDAVTCRVAEWMCTADKVCTVAWDYYRQLCRSMFAGVECSRRCNNSITILMRQRKASKMPDCVCDGPDADACVQERTNILRLCYGQTDAGVSISGSLQSLPFFVLLLGTALVSPFPDVFRRFHFFKFLLGPVV